MALSPKAKKRIVIGAASIALGTSLIGNSVEAFLGRQAKTKAVAVQTFKKVGVRNPEQWFDFKKERRLQLNPRRPKDQQTIAIIDHISKQTRIPAESVAETMLHLKYSHPPLGTGIDYYVGGLKNNINEQNRRLAGAKGRNEKALIEKELARLHNILSICGEVQKLPSKFQLFVEEYADKGTRTPKD